MKLNLLLFTSAFTLATTGLFAQDSGPLIDKLVQKGILNDQEAEDLRADLVKDYNQTSAGRINIATSITELKLYGDARYRYQYDDQQAQVPNTNHVTQRSRNRFRLRLYADFKSPGGFFGGFGLETANASDSGMQTIDPGFADSNIYISRYFIGKNFDDIATVILGKQKNPFYSNELYWDADISPVGVTESVAFHKLLGYEESYQPSAGGHGKDGKSVAPTGTTTSSGFNWGNFELTLVAGQFVYNTDNDESAADSDASNDVYMFEQQFIASYKFYKVSLTVAPAFIFYNAGDIPSRVKDDSLNGQPFAEASVSGDSRDLLVVNVPGELKFPVGSLTGRFYGEFAWNLQGEDRFSEVYGVDSALYEDQQSIAWLAGLEIGQGKGKGAWTIFANYRQVGLASIDPNLNDSDFALSRLNIGGVRTGVTYGFTDFLSLALTAQIAEDLDDSIRGGQATTGANLADRNAVNTYQVDVNWKF